MIPESTPDFSLLHATARLPEGWKPAWEDWFAKCAHPEKVEYIVVVDERDQEKWAPPNGNSRGFPVRFEVNRARPCAVDAFNHAARVSTGKVLMVIADDWFPCERWDEELRHVLPSLDEEWVVWVNTQAFPWLMTHPIMTRAYYERPGRGGCPNGELLYPEYISQGSDDDVTYYALRDKVVIQAGRIWFTHRHPVLGVAEDDDVYRRSNRQEAIEVRNRVLARRAAEGFAR